MLGKLAEEYPRHYQTNYKIAEHHMRLSAQWHLNGNPEKGRILRGLAIMVIGTAVYHNPLNAACHCHYANALKEEGAIGLARLHYAQALELLPGNALIAEQITALDGPDWSDQDRATYFLSYSDDPPPRKMRRRRAPAVTDLS